MGKQKNNNSTKVFEAKNQKKVSVKEKIVKALTPQSNWENKGEILDALFWVRIVLGAVMGIAWGAIPLRGWLGFILFFVINFMSAFGYVNYFQGFYDYEDSSEVSQEGLMPSFGLFMGLWITTYTLLHF